MRLSFLFLIVFFCFNSSLHANNDLAAKGHQEIKSTAMIKKELLSLLQNLDEALVSGNPKTVKNIASDIEAVAFIGVQQKENDQRFISEIYDDMLVYTNRFKYPETVSKDPSTPDIWLKKLAKSMDMYLKELDTPRSYKNSKKKKSTP